MAKTQLSSDLEIKAAKLKMIGMDTLVGGNVVVAKQHSTRDGLIDVTIYADHDNITVSLNDIPGINRFIPPDCRLIVTGKGKIAGLSLACDNAAIAINIDEVIIDIDTSNVKHMDYMFSGLGTVKKIEFKQIDTSNVVSMQYMFNSCVQLQELDLGKFDTSNVTTMNSMFNFCSRLTTLDLTPFNTEKVTSMHAMFLDCIDLTSIDMSSFRTPSLRLMGKMFSGCNNLISLDLSNFDLSKVEELGEFACDCMKLTRVEFPKSGEMGTYVKSLRQMFKNCRELIEADLETLRGTEVNNIRDMFIGCDNIERINLRNFNPRALQDGTNAFMSNANQLLLDLRSLDISYFTRTESFVYTSRFLKLVLRKNSYWTNNDGIVRMDEEDYYSMTQTLLQLKENTGTLKVRANGVKRSEPEYFLQAELLRYITAAKLFVLYPIIQ